MLVCSSSLLSACATSRPDHFYILNAQPPGAAEARAAPTTQVTLKVTLPSLVDRPEMIVNTSADGVTVLEHERWGAPLPELVLQTLGRDIEHRRGDILVGSQGGIHAGTPIKITVDVVQMTVRKGQLVSIETHWRILDPHTGKDVVGSEAFIANMVQDSYPAIAQALSDCLGLVADRLVAQLQ
jgi:uncharacterized lipoprotein YmbA